MLYCVKSSIITIYNLAKCSVLLRSGKVYAVKYAAQCSGTIKGSAITKPAPPDLSTFLVNVYQKH